MRSRPAGGTCVSWTPKMSASSVVVVGVLNCGKRSRVCGEDGGGVAEVLGLGYGPRVRVWMSVAK